MGGSIVLLMMTSKAKIMTDFSTETVQCLDLFSQYSKSLKNLFLILVCLFVCFLLKKCCWAALIIQMYAM